MRHTFWGALAAALLVLPAAGQDALVPERTVGDEPATDAAEGQAGALPISPSMPQDGTSVDLDEFLWVARPVVVFADSPADPRFREQIELISDRLGPLEERDVVVFFDADPDARSPLRRRLRPRGFQLVIIGRDGEVERRSPTPWDVRLISGVIDRMPLRRDEIRLQRQGVDG